MPESGQATLGVEPDCYPRFACNLGPLIGLHSHEDDLLEVVEDHPVEAVVFVGAAVRGLEEIGGTDPAIVLVPPGLRVERLATGRRPGKRPGSVRPRRARTASATSHGERHSGEGPPHGDGSSTRPPRSRPDSRLRPAQHHEHDVERKRVQLQLLIEQRNFELLPREVGDRLGRLAIVPERTRWG